ncbi:signal transduction histidine kinase/DNA-binding NarL/FixJ family response regulator/HPt (histidine-containing phosphotransfer) domain-containing protein [Azospirillum agricola]|uniref:hybrid sensor histidine kinase/response regulator n=1 Tax=Azospirillum agricola TaxID=1720247 RepID=UPI001AE6F731|nr:ATP-binding protein [Azospirillum agricola]MBP2227930.1 signal transduction histidine kinase/DNA-binding NarL/FixJ family response regulator/HPt (histidine-containing phosphotransfer) domain-containing protein [Azospirillum agricola]
MTRAGIAQRIAAVGGVPVLVAAAIAVAAWFLLAQADRARQSAVIAGTVYRELMGAAAARSDYLHAAPARRAPQAALFDARTAEARRQLDALAALAGDGELTAAVAANRRTLGGYAERMERFKAVTEGNDALIATMAQQAARLVEITDSARQRQRIANIRFSESIAESDRRLRLNRDVLDHARGLRNALAGLWRYEATRLAAVDEAATQLDINVLTARLQLTAKALDEAMAGMAGQPATGQTAPGQADSGQPAAPDSFAAVTADLGQALAARTPVQGLARALDGRIDQIINIHSTAYASVQDELTELTGHAVEANETEQEVQNIAVAVLKLTGRTADAVVQRDTAAATRILGDAALLEETMARLPIPPLIQGDMIDATDSWRRSLTLAKDGLARQEAMIAEMDADAGTMAAGAHRLNDAFGDNAERIGAILRSILALGATAGLLLAATATLLVARSITRPIQSLQRQMVRLAESPLAGQHPAEAIAETDRRDELGAMARAVQLFVTEIGQREIALHQARDQAVEATLAKSSFLAMMSHEIRTPMNGVTGMAEMLGQTDLTDEQRGMVGVIRSSARALLTIINDILDFSKIEAGKLEIESIAFSLTEVVEDAAELVTGRAEEKALDLVVLIDDGVPDQLLGDPTRLRQVLINLAGNAIKFTESGHVALRVRRLPGGDDAAESARLRFTVSDTGIGLTGEQRARLFQPFQQADSSTSRRFGGTGLGLTICHRLCALMGGAIGVDSVHGEGSTFWFELPFPMVAPEPLAPAVAIADARVVAVGFDGPRRAALEGILRAGGVGSVAWVGYDDDPLARIAAVSAGPAHESAQEDAQEGASEETPGVAVILHTAGTTDAAMACGKRIVEAGIRPAPKVMLTASRLLVSSLGEADRIGLFCTLTLPLRRQRLWQVLAAVLGRASLERRGGAQDDDAAGWTPPPVEEARAAGCLILVAEDNPINQTVIRRMLNQRGYALEMADDGVQALALHRPGRYGLLLTDFHMPEMDGFTLTRMLRQREESEGIDRLPIVALTADALPGTEQRCLEAGMDGYLTKPIDSRLLAAVLDRHLPRARALRRRARPVERLAPPSPTAAPARTWRDADIDPAIFDLAQLAGNFAPGDPDAIAFLERFLEMVPGLIGTAAGRLADGDAAAARDAVHTLKGASLSIGAARLGQLAADAQDCLDAGDADTAALLVDLLAPTQEELVEATAALREFTAGMAPCRETETR